MHDTRNWIEDSSALTVAYLHREPTYVVILRACIALEEDEDVLPWPGAKWCSFWVTRLSQDTDPSTQIGDYPTWDGIWRLILCSLHVIP